MNFSEAIKRNISQQSGENIYSSIVQCFSVIFIGYISARAHWITDTQVGGLGIFVSKFALPALLFQNMATLNFSSVNWTFLISILISKSAVFILITIFGLIVTRPINFGKCGIYSIFATQSNDFALGYPIVYALYSKSHPEFINYIYLLAPISVALLNPIGFFLMELQKRRESDDRQTGYCLIIFKVFGGVLINPIIFMTALGLSANLLFQRELPGILGHILKVLGNSYSACALFFLGHSLSGKMKDQLGMKLLMAVLLITSKMLILPLVIREVVANINNGNSSETVDYSTYGFLYGTFPTAPTVFLFASQYEIEVDLIATAMVVGTFLSAPLMFVSAKMITLPVAKLSNYDQFIFTSSFDVACVGLGCSVWVFVVFLLNKRNRSFPHQITLILTFFQAAGCISMMTYKSVNQNTAWQHYLHFIWYSFSTLGARIFVSVLAISLLFLRMKSVCYALKKRIYLYSAGLGLPLALTGILLIFGKKNSAAKLPQISYGPLQICPPENTSLGPRQNVTSDSQRPLLCSDSSDQPSILDNLQDDISEEELENSAFSINNETAPMVLPIEENEPSRREFQSIEDIIPFPPNLRRNTRHTSLISERSCENARCSEEQRRECQRLVRSLERPVTLSESGDTYQFVRHVILVLFLCLPQLVCLSLNIWRLTAKWTSGAFVELEFLDAVLNYGQGAFSFCVFGFDSHMVLEPFIRRWRKWLYGSEVIRPASRRYLDPVTKRKCDQFSQYHLETCKRNIAKDTARDGTTWRNSFSGKALVTWILNIGLAADRFDAKQYGRRLLRGNVIEHIEGERDLHDEDHLYRFTDAQDEEHPA
ncbi:DgyrCDS492 [Dimorphilus gyrociliatus]|uniref:DgyrCDS492 n=1 Tax=Dimorphilus gyrociliatus TaxID=2664684 RepID=A0A7I8V6B2_9ANNE|nr:DgyrCDS492 [Dimorphilus gyrociliatus]